MAAVIAVLIVCFGHRREGVVEAAPVVIDWCVEVCDQNASCFEPCLVEQPELPALEITCGMYDGGPANDWCDGNSCDDQCSWRSSGSDLCYWENEQTTCEDYGLSGYCGDDICVPAQGETCGTCENDCQVCPAEPTCPNSLCELGETFRSCPQDCEPPGDDPCGDGQCSETEDGESCPADCTFSGDWCGDFPECPEGWECIDEVCVWEDDPFYYCCGDSPDHSFHCTYGREICSVTDVCKQPDSADGPGDPPLCLPAWWSSSGG